MNKRIIALTLIAALATPAIANAGRPGKPGKPNDERLIKRIKSASEHSRRLKDRSSGSADATTTVKQSKPGLLRAKGKKKFVVDGIVRDINGRIVTVFVSAGTASVKDYRGQAVDVDAGSARIKKRGKTITLTQIKVGDRGHIAGSLVFGADNALTLTAARVTIKPERPGPASAALKNNGLKNATETTGPQEGQTRRQKAAKKARPGGAAGAILRWLRSLF